MMSKRLKHIRQFPDIDVDVPLRFNMYAKDKMIITTKDRAFGSSYKYDVKRNRFIERKQS